MSQEKINLFLTGIIEELFSRSSLNTYEIDGTTRVDFFYDDLKVACKQAVDLISEFHNAIKE